MYALHNPMTTPFQTAVIVLDSNKLALVKKDFSLMFTVLVRSCAMIKYHILRNSEGE